MRSVFPSRGAFSLAARSIVGAGLLVAVSLGCNVDDSGLAATSVKLQRDAGGAGGAVATGGGVGTGGVNGGGGGVTGSGGTIVGGTGGTPGTGGVAATGGMTGGGGAPGTGGLTATGGASGTGGTPATGGAPGTGGTPATGGATGSGGAPGTGGATATGGVTGTGGTPATGGSPGTGGTPGTGGKIGTGGTTGTGGTGGTKCGPGTCDGCCSTDGSCVRNSSAAQCGRAGAACVACAPCEICSGSSGSANSCAIDPSSQWKIVAVSGQVSTTPPGGGTWDPAHGDEGGSAPDLFCEYENPANSVSATTAGVTDTITDVLTANWNQTITPPGVTVSASALMASKPAWRIWVGDEDCSNGKCGTMGQIACSYQQPITAASLESGQVTISNYQNCVALTLQLVCQAPAATP